MITQALPRLARSLRALLFSALALLAVQPVRAANFFDNVISGIDLGDASGGSTRQWAIFSLSGGVTITDPFVDGSYDVLGNVAVAGGNLMLQSSRVQGSVYLHDTATVSLSGGPVITGSTNYFQSALLTPAVWSANSASSTASGLAPTLGSPTTIVLYNTAQNLSAPANTTYVMNLTSLILSGAGAVLTLNGTSTTNYVINVSRYLTLSSGASIQLSGGLQPQNVLFNVSNSYGYDVTMSGGSTLNGIILSPNRNVKLTGGATVNGEVIARAVSLSGRSKVINPIVSP